LKKKAPGAGAQWGNLGIALVGAPFLGCSFITKIVLSPAASLRFVSAFSGFETALCLSLAGKISSRAVERARSGGAVRLSGPLVSRLPSASSPSEVKAAQSSAKDRLLLFLFLFLFYSVRFYSKKIPNWVS
jgi:hypothetical protein